MKNKSFEDQVRIYKEIAIHYGRTKSVSQLSREMGLPKDDITAAAFKLRKLGLDIPCLRMKGGTMGTAIAELSAEHPELFRKKKAIQADDRISRILANRPV